MVNKPTPEEARMAAVSAYVEATIDEAYSLREEYDGYLKRKKANRETLRNMAAQGQLTDEQAAEVAELYPNRTKAAEDAEDAAEGVTEDTPEGEITEGVAA